jgi:hypothetical protein
VAACRTLQASPAQHSPVGASTAFHLIAAPQLLPIRSHASPTLPIKPYCCGAPPPAHSHTLFLPHTPKRAHLNHPTHARTNTQILTLPPPPPPPPPPTPPQESEYFLGSDEDPELPRHKIGRTISHASLGSDHGGMPSIYSMANLPR